MKTDKLTNQQNLADVLKRFADHVKNTSDGALVVEATIVDIIDEGVGEYSVEYFGNTFSAYSNNRDASYSIGDNVYISVPERDFSKTKLIIGLSNPQNAVFTNNDNQVIYNEVSDNLITNDFGIIEFCSYETTRVENQPISGYSSTNFSKILNSYKTFSFSCSVKTQLPVEQQNSGIYGLTLNIPLEINAAAGGGSKELVWKSFPLDTTNMMGNFYRFEEWTPQTVYFELDPQYTISAYYVPTISYYCYDFIQDASKTTKDIFIKDIVLHAVEELSTVDESGYGLSLKASEGPYFGTYYATTKTITPTLRFNKKVVRLRENNAEVYWFKECVDIKNDSDDYCVYGGFGWQCLNPKTNIAMNSDGTQTFSWVTSNLTLSVPSTEVSISTRYKCVVIYKQTAISAIIELKDLDTTKSFELNAKDGNTVLIKDTGYAHLVATVYIDDVTDKEDFRNSIIYSWMRYDKNNNYISDEDSFFEVVRYNEIVNGKYETEIQFPVNRIEDINYIYCSATFVDDNLKKELLGTRSVGLSTSVLYEYNLIIDNDDLIYKYDVNGDSPAGTAYDGPSTSKVTEIAPLNYTIKKASGEELTPDEYCYVQYLWIVPKNSLFIVSDATEEDDDYYYFRGYDNFNHTAALLKYKIANRYNLSKANGAIILQVAFNGRVLSETVNINFIKEGMNGTNGTAYAARLVSGGLTAETSVPYGTLNAKGYAQKLKFVYNISTGVLKYYDYDTDALYDWDVYNKRIFTQVYENSSLLTYGTEYRVTYSMFDDRVTEPCFEIADVDSVGGVLLGLKETPDMTKYPCNILQARVTVLHGNSSVANSQEEIYVYYPIELTITNMETNIIPTIEGGFAEVQYAADGTNPAWDQTAPFVIRENQQLAVIDYYNVQWEAKNHITAKEDIDTDFTLSEVHFSPDNKYDDGNSKNYVAATMMFDTGKTAEVAAEIARLQNENVSLMAQKAVAASNLSYLQNFATKFTYNTWMNTLEQIKPVLDIQTNMVYNAKTILSTIDDLNSYINTQIQYSSKPIAIVCANLIVEKNALQSRTNDAITQVERLNGVSPYAFEDLISLNNNKITWTDEIKEEYTQELGLDTAINFELLITNINQAINAYQKYYNQIDTPQNRADINTYDALIVEIQDACTEIPNTAYARFVDLKTKVLKYLEYFDTFTSIKDIKNCINLMYLDALSTTFDLQNGILTVKQITTDEINALQDYYQYLIDNNNLTIINLQAIALTSGYGIFHIRPIVIYLNRYSMSNINAWDGNKIETGDGNYLLAPQVGAGKKESDNSFTGVVIGQRNIGSTVGSGAEAQLGLFGYSKGKQSIFMNAENGSAIFGVPGNGGQIIIDPASSTTKALLYSSNFWKNYNSKTGLPTSYSSGNYNGAGLLIDLTTPEIRYGSGNFVVNSAGHITAKGGGSIAGWQISDTVLTGGRTTLNCNGTITCTDLEASESGHIGGWTIGSTTLKGGATTLYANGTINCANLIASTAGEIGGWIINAAGLASNNSKVVLSCDGTLAGGPGDGTATWIIDSSTGIATFHHIIADYGTIAGWNVTGTGFNTGANGTQLKSNGTIECINLIAKNQGNIGGWTISSDGLKGESNISLKPDGTILCKKLTINSTEGYMIWNSTVSQIASVGWVNSSKVSHGSYNFTATGTDSMGGSVTVSGTINL